MGIKRKEERVKMNFRLIKKNVDYFKQKGISINRWINEQMEKYVKNDKN